MGQASYALVLTEDAGVVDDIFVYRMGPEDWLVVPNAANVGPVAKALRASGAEPEDEWNRYAILALQGPESDDVFSSVFPGGGATDLKLHRWTDLDMFGEQGFVARTGYTGERGFELYVPGPVAVRTFEALLEGWDDPRRTRRARHAPARDGLRALRARADDRDEPVGGRSRAGRSRGPARSAGRDALLEIKERGPERKLFGIRLSDRGVPRQGYSVWRGDEQVGEVCSGNFSPTLGCGIALAYGRAGRRAGCGRSRRDRGARAPDEGGYREASVHRQGP